MFNENIVSAFFFFFRLNGIEIIRNNCIFRISTEHFVQNSVGKIAWRNTIITGFLDEN